jgi:hypothetical protein
MADEQVFLVVQLQQPFAVALIKSYFSIQHKGELLAGKDKTAAALKIRIPACAGFLASSVFGRTAGIISRSFL